MNKSEMELSGDWDIVSSDEKEKNSENDSANGSPNEAECKNPPEGSRMQDVADFENAPGNESSSSDIDIIDENMDEIEVPPESCLLPTLTIYTPVEKICDCSAGDLSPSSSESITTAASQHEQGEETKNEDFETSAPKVDSCPFMSRKFGGRSIKDWTDLIWNIIWDYVQSMTAFQLSCIFGLTFCLYFCITINNTNIIALQEKGNVVAQMEKLVDELRNDNKHLQEQMLSEMKNDKLVSSFEHQIRELKKENSKLNHMLYDVVKVLEQQKNTQEKLLEKKESEYQAPFKKEINKLKEHINILKFDNEELQKQLVRMRYSSYSQGSKHDTAKDKNEHGKHRSEKKSEGGKSSDIKDEQNSGNEKSKEGESRDYSGEIPMDLQQLKRWNELLDQVARELGILEKDGYSKDKSDSTTEDKGDWNWQEELKRKLKKPREYVSGVASNYANLYGKMINKIYKSASSYITDAQENVQSLFDSFQGQEKNPEQKFKMWNFINDLGEKWDEVKKKVLSNYNINSKCPTEKDSGKADVSETIDVAPPMQETKEDKVIEPLETYYESEQEELPKDAEKEKWFFKRANLREEIREDENEESGVNWFLRKKRRDLLSQKYGDVDPTDKFADENERK